MRTMTFLSHLAQIDDILVEYSACTSLYFWQKEKLFNEFVSLRVCGCVHARALRLSPFVGEM